MIHSFMDSSSSSSSSSWLLLVTTLSLIILIPLILLSSVVAVTKQKKNLPPAPLFRLPLIGHLHLVKLPLAQSFHTLSLRHGPIFSLRFGSRLVIVISSADTVDASFTAQNDPILANRPRLLLGKYVAYNHSTLVTAPYGESWRKLRRICSTELFSSSTLARFASARAGAVENLIRRVAAAGGEKPDESAAAVELRPLLKEMMFDVLMRMVSGMGVDEVGLEFVEMVNQVLQAADTANPADFVPVLKWVDFGGYQKRIKKLARKADGLLQGIVDEKRRSRMVGAGKEDSMIDRLLELQESDPAEFYSDVMIKGLMIVIFSAGTDTTSLTIEWAMSLLLNHPETLTKLKQEIDSHVGQNRMVNDSDLTNFPYLQTIIWETLRLYPPSPLLLPHYASQDCTISGFTVPQDTMVFVNAWAVHRDPAHWADPLSFKPGRFEQGGGVESSSRFVPFGIGRRACPGAGLANRVVCLVLAALVHCFDWERLGGVQIDMEEGQGLTMPKKIPLAALCREKLRFFASLGTETKLRFGVLAQAEEHCRKEDD